MVRRAPPVLRLGAFLVRADRGGYKLLNIAQRRGRLDKVVRYQISPNVMPVAFEAHPDVVSRTGDEPVETVRLITAAHPCTVTVPEVPGLVVDLGRPLFSQIPSPKTRGYNVVCRSVAPPATAALHDR